MNDDYYEKNVSFFNFLKIPVDKQWNDFIFRNYSSWSASNFGRCLAPWVCNLNQMIYLLSKERLNTLKDQIIRTIYRQKKTFACLNFLSYPCYLS